MCTTINCEKYVNNINFQGLSLSSLETFQNKKHCSGFFPFWTRILRRKKLTSYHDFIIFGNTWNKKGQSYIKRVWFMLPISLFLWPGYEKFFPRTKANKKKINISSDVFGVDGGFFKWQVWNESEIFHLMIFEILKEILWI